MHKCENCQWKGARPLPMPEKDIHERVSPGEPMPSGECPECNAVCHPVPSKAPKREDPAKTLAKAVTRLNGALRSHAQSTKNAKTHREDRPKMSDEDHEAEYHELYDAIGIESGRALGLYVEAQVALMAMLRDAGIIGRGTLQALVPVAR